jgi:hypothetical protein
MTAPPTDTSRRRKSSPVSGTLDRAEDERLCVDNQRRLARNDRDRSDVNRLTRAEVQMSDQSAPRTGGNPRKRTDPETYPPSP